ncbi:glycosyltransferase family A protein [Acinetobacter sp. MD2]|uniref:glycosyltransferase family 2 protein n=1 Tax=Acinetobacter sp. MD2 TaxID=2600066 RepID=UPI002D1F165A|nr:glycosyltransferase family A protein [Acinetobacter sp. MD2]MEB3767350.1 glycosyltransferase family 2 protein [Acinetobacter sp. MD2]
MTLIMQTKKPSVAVIIAYYNGAKWIERALKSIFEQTYLANEVIVVNDGSTPEEKDALYTLQKKYTFTILDKENGGQGSARNFGVTHSQSDYICFLDQDDFYLPQHIELLYDAIPANDTLFGFVYGDCKEADENGCIVLGQMINEHSKHPKLNIFDFIESDMFILPSASLICKKAYSSVSGFDEQFMGYEDDDLFLRIFRAGYNHYYIEDAVYVWCIHSNSTSYSIKMSRSRYRYFLKLVNSFQDEPLRGRFYLKDYLIPRFGKSFIHDIIKYSDANSKEKDEILSIFSSYITLVKNNKFVPKTYILKLELVKITFSLFSYSVIKKMAYILYIPFFRRLFKKLV